MSAIIQRMQDTLDFMVRQRADPAAIETMKESLMHQQLWEEVIETELSKEQSAQ